MAQENSIFGAPVYKIKNNLVLHMRTRARVHTHTHSTTSPDYSVVQCIYTEN